MRRSFLLIACFVSVPWLVQSAEMYRWMGPNGVMHYSDSPPPKSEQAKIRMFSSASGSEEALSYATLRAKQNFPVTLYLDAGCVEVCDQARSLLNKRGIPFTEKSLKTKEDIESFKRLSGINGVPALAVGKTFLSGFLASQWHSELDIAGYPKIPPYRAPGASNPVAPDNKTKQ